MMKLIGMLDSPFVRRVAISLQMLDIRFYHEPLSVFSDYDQFQAQNPVVKAPSLVLNDGTVLMDSNLIIQWAEQALDRSRLMLATGLHAHTAHRLVGLAYIAMEKSVQRIYEGQMRPEDKQHQPWLDRISEQLVKVYQQLEEELPRPGSDRRFSQVEVSSAVAWYFTKQTSPGLLADEDFPKLAKLSEMAEQRPEFKAAPYGDGTYPVS